MLSLLLLFALCVPASVFSQRVQVGDVAPQFTATTVDGNVFSLQETAKDSIVVIYFMGYNCGICKSHAPELEENIHQYYRDFGVRVLGLDVWDGSVSLLNTLFIQPTGSTYDFVPQSSNIGTLYGFSVHSFVVVGRDLTVKFTSTYYDEQGLQDTLDILTNTAGEKPDVVPFDFYLSQNYPNPFNPSTVIKFEVKLSESVNADLIVYDALGNRVKALFSDRVTSGFYSFEWDGHDANGDPVASGVYFYQLSMPDLAETKRMLLLR